MTRLIQILLLAGGLALAGLIVWAFLAGDFSAAGAWLTSDPWGIVTLTDLYLGFFIIAIFMALIEKRFLIALFWIAPMPVLGNVWAVAWMLLRWGRIREELFKARGE